MNTPAVVLAAANVCSKSVWRIKNLPTTPRSPLSAQQQQLVEDSIQDLNAVLASPAFNTAVTSSTYDQTQTMGRSPEAIYDLMVSSSPLQLTITLYTDKNPFSGNEGFEDESSPGTAYGNLKAIQGNRGFLASLVLHEIMHLLGFGHDKDKPLCSSVPYSMNRIYASVAQSLGLTPPGPRNPCS